MSIVSSTLAHVCSVSTCRTSCAPCVVLLSFVCPNRAVLTNCVFVCKINDALFIVIYKSPETPSPGFCSQKPTTLSRRDGINATTTLPTFNRLPLLDQQLQPTALLPQPFLCHVAVNHLKHRLTPQKQTKSFNIAPTFISGHVVVRTQTNYSLL